MASKIVICVLLLAVLGCSSGKLHKTKKGSHFKVKKGYKTKPIPEDPIDVPREPVSPCEGVFCGAGRQCVITDNEPSCQCADFCAAIHHPVCGSNGVTYPNKCELHRAACLQEIKITQLKAGACKVAPTVAQTHSPPVVCYQADRNVLQKQIVQWIQSKESVDGWFLAGKKYKDVVDEYFQMFDESHDDVLDTAEFIKFVEHNETVRNSTSLDENTEGDNQLMRSMCVDALVAEADRDFDWRLNKEEFESCLSPDFHPGTRMCSLEGREYPDGDVVPNRCNECVCACGNWVCTANACDGDVVAGTDAQEEYNPIEEENAMNQKEWTAIMKKLARLNPEQFPDHVRDLKHLNEKIRAEEPSLEDILGEDVQHMLEEEEAEFQEELTDPIAPVDEEPQPVPEKPIEVDIPKTPRVPERPRIPEMPRVPERPRIPERPRVPEIPRVPQRPRGGKHKGSGRHGGKHSKVPGGKKGHKRTGKN